MKAIAGRIVVVAMVCVICGATGAAEVHTAAANGELEKIKELLAADPELVNVQDASGKTPLHWAARGVHVDVAKYLLKKGADVTIPDANRVIPLHSVAYRGADELVKLMISSGADVDTIAYTGLTPLHFAILGGRLQTIELLLTNGAALEAADGLGNSPLLLACSYGLEEIAVLLLEHGAQVEHRNKRGDTPLTVANREGHDEIVKLLIDNGADETRMRELRLPEGPYLGQGAPGRRPEMFAPRIVSTERGQLNAVFSPDGKEFYFTKRRPGGSSIMVMKMEKSEWSRPVPAGFSGPHADVDHFMTRDGRKMYFCSNRPLTEGAEVRGNVDMWVSVRSGESWEEPRHLGATVNSEGDDYYPTLADDGTLYFSSTRAGGLGENDIYHAPLVDGEFRDPINLGPAVNSPSREFDPYIAPSQSYVIFASERPGGYGSSDLYISFRGPHGQWTRARNMGSEINSDSADFTPMLTPDGKYLFLTSDRAGASDLYWVDARIIQELRAMTGPYFGQEPPGLEPEIFAPQILSRTQPEWAFCGEFSPDHGEFYFSQADPELDIDRIMWMRNRGGGWTDPEPAPFYTPHNTNDSRISPDGQRLYFRSRRPLPGNEDPEKRLLLWSVSRDGESWEEPQPVLFGGRPARTSHAGVAANGTLYFSYRGDDADHADVHRAPLVEGSYTAPENLGDGINTEYSEGDVFVAPDESFLIVTIWDHPDNSGDSDLYISFREADGSWSAPKNLGKPVNTEANENCAAFSPDGKYFFYVAVSKKGEIFEIDTYWIDAAILESHRKDPR